MREDYNKQKAVLICYFNKYNMRKSVYFLFFLLFGLFELIVLANDLDVKKSQWKGFERHDFKYNGVKSLLVIPDSPA